jgi:hypothetical protein
MRGTEKGKDDVQREVAGPGHTGGARQCRRRGHRGLRLGAVLLAWLVFIVAKVANLPFDTEGADSIALSTTGIVDRLVQDSPSLTRPPFITGHMTSSTVQASVVDLAPFPHP